MSFRTIGTVATAVALMISVPAAATAASVRPGSAVPTAASAVSVGSSAQRGQAASVTPWPAYAIIALTLALGVWIATQDSDDGLSISRG